ncbi:MAG: colicin V synthesis protein [Hyphomicrobiales bacterium]|nr:MAG: colicin V synthesis protein [Hyphomicrobiales bacterium]
MASPLTALDFIVIAIMLISGGLALLRGFTREVLSIVSWIAAAAATLFLFPMFQADIRGIVQPKWLADIALAAGIFLVVLILVSFITMKISDKVLDSRVGALDRTLGFIFGVVRGFLLIVVAYLFFVWLVPPRQFPNWIAQARSMPVMKAAGAKILAWLPADPESLIRKGRSNAGGGKSNRAGASPAKTAPASKTPDKKTDNGYKKSQRRDMQQLLESATGNKPQ